MIQKRCSLRSSPSQRFRAVLQPSENLSHGGPGASLEAEAPSSRPMSRERRRKRCPQSPPQEPLARVVQSSERSERDSSLLILRTAEREKTAMGTVQKNLWGLANPRPKLGVLGNPIGSSTRRNAGFKRLIFRCFDAARFLVLNVLYVQAKIHI